MTRRAIVTVALFFGVAYAISSAIRGQVIPGIVTGALGAVLVYLVLVRVRDHHDALRRKREREQGQS